MEIYNNHITELKLKPRHSDRIATLKLFELMLLNYGVEEDLLGLQGDPTSPS